MSDRGRLSQAVPLVFFFILPVLSPQSASADLSLMTFNIRYGTAKDAGNLWEDRRESVAEVIRTASPDLFGVQEALDFQMKYLEQAFQSDYISVGEGREGGIEGEFSAIFFSAHRFRLESAGRFWLSDTPETVGSKSWSGLPRMVTWCRLIEKETGRRLAFASTHFSHDTEEARLKSAQLIASKFGEMFESNLPVILVGDFNCRPGSPPHQILTGQEGGFLDAMTASGEPPRRTFNGFRRVEPGGQPIDWILYRGGGLGAATYKILDGTYLGRTPSDHFPVFATLHWPD
jgi:endonuclease/exonuclease/phosphatase family metal-dependent hydrolase